MVDRDFKIRSLGEIAIRCNDLKVMTEFYSNIIGLELLSDFSAAGIVFFKISEGYAGHTSVLALFDKSAGRQDIHPTGSNPPHTGALSSLHHIALGLPFSEQTAAMAWYEANDINYTVEKFGWIGWQGIFTKDPEGNTVELVAYDKSLLD